MDLPKNNHTRFANLIQAETPYFVDASRIPEESMTIIDLPMKQVRPGAAYILELDLYRDRNEIGTYPLVRLFDREQRLNDFWQESKWQTLSLVLSAPEKLSQEPPRLSLVVPKGDFRLFIRKVELKAIRLHPLFPQPETNLNENEVTFAWDIPATDRLLDLKLKISQDKNISDQDTLVFETDNREQRLEPEVSLAPGRWYWKIEAWQYRTKLAESPVQSFHVIEKPAQKMGVEAGQKPGGKDLSDSLLEELPPPPLDLDFFPIGIYDASEADFAELSTAGFNAVQISARDWISLEPLLRRAESHNLRALLSFQRPLIQKEIRENALSSAIHHHILHAWYLDDEPEGRSISPKHVRSGGDAIRQIGFPEPGAIALLRSWRIRDYAGAADVFMSDPYPVPFNPLSWQGTALDEINQTIGGDPTKQAWAVVQAFGWQYSSAQARATGKARIPSPEEVRALTYIALIHGAKGLYYYTYGSGRYRIKEHPELWQGLLATVGEVRDLLSLFKSEEADRNMNIQITCNEADEWDIPAIHYSARQVTDRPEPAVHSPAQSRQIPAETQPGLNQALQTRSDITKFDLVPGIYIIAVNTLDQPVMGRMTFAPQKDHSFTEILDIFTGTSTPLLSGPTTIEFAPLQRRIFLIQ